MTFRWWDLIVRGRAPFTLEAGGGARSPEAPSAASYETPPEGAQQVLVRLDGRRDDE
jgi:hypothetical protein